MHENVAAASLAFLRLRSEPRPIPTHPRSGAQSAANSPEPALEDIMAPLDAVVFTVSATGVPGVAELGLTEQVGASAGIGDTAQVNATEPLNPAGAVTLTLEVAEPPALTIAGVRAEAESEKSRSNVAKTTVSAEPVVTLQVPVPEQPVTPQVVKADPEEALALSVTAVPGG
jgi:hypothetical protein